MNVSSMNVVKYLEWPNDLFSIGLHKSKWINSKVCVALVPIFLNDGRICLLSKQDVHIIFSGVFGNNFTPSVHSGNLFINGRLRCPSLWCHTYESWSEMAKHSIALACTHQLARHASAIFWLVGLVIVPPCTIKFKPPCRILLTESRNLKIDLVHIEHFLLVFVLSRHGF